MLTRFRVEASNKTSNEVKDDLILAGSTIRALAGGEWEYNEEEDLEIVGSSDGFWGRLTIRRVINAEG
jgi:hypothetical protein